MIPNRPRPPYIEAHRILELQSMARLTPNSPQQEETALRPFTIREHFERGGYESSLFAPSDGASADWLDRRLREDMPLLPLEYDAPVFWSVVARRNGDPATSIQRALRRKMETWQRAFAAAHRDDILFELPFWPDDSQGRAPLVYFSDSGLWHRAFAPFRDPLAIRNVLYDAKAWEGFNVNAFRRLTLPYANCFVWRRDGAQAGEIDLVLDWRSGDRWAIEISRDPNKRASPAYAQGVEMVSAVRKLIVRPGAPRLERRMNYEYVNIEGALRFIADACLANVERASEP
jgi:hypothetical protein